MYHRGEPLTETVWEKLMLGLSTRKYGQAVREFTEAYGRVRCSWAYMRKDAFLLIRRDSPPPWHSHAT
jgi:hypothetical protein